MSLHDRFIRKLANASESDRELKLSPAEAQWLQKLFDWVTEVYELPFTVDDVHEELGGSA